ncbi:MAG: putative lipid II flippase FtsW [Gammaproteobacteria bacterium CG22_combo_CG10-13_8_21_14_all_40_8]|nr:MAG: putative lipid II flippase FtsW [Gammaproteobacteria bacterium CG22_combo_CG10-13_8_21_14_all_40_8]
MNSLFLTTIINKNKQQQASVVAKPAAYDAVLLAVSLGLMLIGLIMVASSSVPVATRLTGNAFYFVLRHGVYLILALVIGAAVAQVKIKHWQTLGPWLLLGGLFLLMLVLVVGREVNGSKRWLNFGFFTIQVSELVKLFVVVYLAGYLVRFGEVLRTQIEGFLRPLFIMFLVTGFLLMEPDFGASAVIVVTVLAMMFLAGARLWQFIVLAMGVGGALALVALTQEYRLMRLKSFLDPWSDPYGNGYQLTQSLIAFGRGGLFGEGLGNSVQKLNYLPEAHTDFVLAILAEEFGFLGIIVIVGLFCVILYRALSIGNKALQAEQPFSGYMAYGFGFGLFVQAMVNLGVASGLLPTKGLTLPLVSYGGSSLIVSFLMVILLLRIDFETRQKKAKGAIDG